MERTEVLYGGEFSDRFRQAVARNAVLIALVLLFAVFTYLTGGVFLSVRNLSNLSLQTAAVSIIAMGMVLVIVSGNIDLSAGSVVGAVGAATAVMQVQMGAQPVAAISVGLVFGLCIGMWHGYWIAYRGVPSIIVTLASMLALRGAAIAITQGKTQAPLDPGFLWIGQSYLPTLGLFPNDTTIIGTIIIGLGVLMVAVKRLGGSSAWARNKSNAAQIMAITIMIVAIGGVMSAYRGMPVPLLIVCCVWLVLSFVATKTVFGKQVFAIGGNARAAVLSGVDVKARIFGLFSLMGVVTAIAAFVFTARVGSASASAGAMMELDAIAAAIIGGTSLAGGIGSIGGAIIGALVMTTLDNGMSLLNLDASYQLAIKALILLLAVWFDTVQKRRG